MKIRLQGTENEVREMKTFLQRELGDRILEISRPYQDRNGKTCRVYMEVTNEKEK